MEGNHGKIPIIKKEEVVLHKQISNLVDDLQAFDGEFDERILESIGKNVGFHSVDDKVYSPVTKLQTAGMFRREMGRLDRDQRQPHASQGNRGHLEENQ